MRLFGLLASLSLPGLGALPLISLAPCLGWLRRLLTCLPAVLPADAPLAWLELIFGLTFLLWAALSLLSPLLPFAHDSDAVAFFEQVRSASDDGVARLQSADDLDLVILRQAGFEGDEFSLLRFDHVDAGLIAAIDERVAWEQGSFSRAAQVEFDAREHLSFERPVAVRDFDLDNAVARLRVEHRRDAHDAARESLSGQAVDRDRYRKAAFDACDVALGRFGLDDHRREADYSDDRSPRVGHGARMSMAFGDEAVDGRINARLALANVELAPLGLGLPLLRARQFHLRHGDAMAHFEGVQFDARKQPGFDQLLFAFEFGFGVAQFGLALRDGGFDHRDGGLRAFDLLADFVVLDLRDQRPRRDRMARVDQNADQTPGYFGADVHLLFGAERSGKFDLFADLAGRNDISLHRLDAPTSGGAASGPARPRRGFLIF